ncbi:MAG TPA: cobyrinate a,c-diamide synthase [Acidimicrobiales bacterium]|jgi:cobyrinic acid a,c-diamide synthase
MARLGPRVVIAGTHSGVGKTTVATGLMAGLRQRAVQVGAAKVGPDFIDTGYHALATGRPGRNLDAWICGPDAIGPLAGRAGEGCDITIIEGAMGLFDGVADPDGPVASTAQVASLLGAPIILVVDASSMSGSVAALVHGYRSFDPAIQISGVILNRVGSESHEALLREALLPLGIPVLGCLRRDGALQWRERHLGLVPIAESAAAVRTSLARLAAVVEASCRLDAIAELARSAPPVTFGRPPAAVPAGNPSIAVASGPAFSFYYADNLELLEQAGAELVPFDPRSDKTLPGAIDGLYAGGGFPEVFAAELAHNRPLLDDVGGRVGGGLPTWAECGGLLWLAKSLDSHQMADVIAARGRMTDKLTLGYRRATLRSPSFLGAAGMSLRGHEFHYSVLDPPGDGLDWSGRAGNGRGGYVTPTLFASYLHLHLGSTPELAERFVRAAATVRLPR